jgi:hypothetical protein
MNKVTVVTIDYCNQFKCDDDADTFKLYQLLKKATRIHSIWSGKQALNYCDTDTNLRIEDIEIHTKAEADIIKEQHEGEIVADRAAEALNTAIEDAH